MLIILLSNTLTNCSVLFWITLESIHCLSRFSSQDQIIWLRLSNSSALLPASCSTYVSFKSDTSQARAGTLPLLSLWSANLWWLMQQHCLHCACTLLLLGCGGNGLPTGFGAGIACKAGANAGCLVEVGVRERSEATTELLACPGFGEADLVLENAKQPWAWTVWSVGSLHTITGVCTPWAESAVAPSSSVDRARADLALGVGCWLPSGNVCAKDFPVLARSSVLDPVTEEIWLVKYKLFKDGSDWSEPSCLLW